MYFIDFDDLAIDFLEKSQKEISKRIWNKIISTKENPHRYFEKLKKRTDYKLRVGNYRVIADIYDNEKKIIITLIDHRNKIYKKLK